MLVPYLFGEHNSHLRYIEEALSLDIASRGSDIEIKGSNTNVGMAKELFTMLWEKLTREQDVTTSEIDAALRFIKEKDKKMPTKEKKTAKKKDKEAFFDEKAGIKTYKNKPEDKKALEKMASKVFKQPELRKRLGPALEEDLKEAGLAPGELDSIFTKLEEKAAKKKKRVTVDADELEGQYGLSKSEADLLLRLHGARETG